MASLTAKESDLLISIGIDTKSLSKFDKDLGKALKKADKNLYDFNTKVNKASPAFAGWAMSIMFAGMAIQRTLMGIAKTSTQTFNDVMHSVEGTVTQTDILAGSWTYLQFTIGQALDPLAEKLVPIVDNIANWIEQNEELVAGFIKWGLIIGTTALIVGGLKLAFDGVVGTLAAIKLILPSVIAGFKSLTTAMFATPLGVLISIVFLLGMIIGLVDKMGGGWSGFVELLKSVGRGILRVVNVMMEGVIWLANKAIEVILTPVNVLIDGINAAIRAYNKFKGKPLDSGTIDHVSTGYEWGDAGLGDYLNWEGQGFLAPSESNPMTNGGNTGVTNTYNINIEEIKAQDESMKALMKELEKYGTNTTNAR